MNTHTRTNAAAISRLLSAAGLGRAVHVAPGWDASSRCGFGPVAVTITANDDDHVSKVTEALTDKGYIIGGENSHRVVVVIGRYSCDTPRHKDTP